ncbi:MAG: SH3 domain-containing protein [Anaerolineaceae bacterium]|nr:SH3 domain-containing protein [Anaerolineaceae bacterium]
MRPIANAAVALSVFMLLLTLSACNLTVSPGPQVEEISGPPQVQILSPMPNSTYLEGVAVNIQVQVRNAGADLARVDFAVDNQLFDSQASPNSAAAATFIASSSWTASGAGAHLLSVIAARSDGSSSAPASVTVTVIGQGGLSGDRGPGGSPADTDGGGEQPQEPEEPPPAAPTTVPEPTSDQPMARVLRGAYVRAGPDTRFAPPIGSIGAGDQVELLAVNIHKTWYKIKYYNGEGWVFGSLLEISGDIDDLPAVWGPPLPQPTAIPPTAAPEVVVGNVNLVAGSMRHNQSDGQIKCNVGFQVEIDVANHGSSRSPGGSVRFQDYATKRDGGRLDSTEAVVHGTFPPVDPGKTVSASAQFSISFHFNEQHIMKAFINHDGAIPETNRTDNEGHFTYTLVKGDRC